MADSAVDGGPLTSVAEFDLLDEDALPIDRSAWRARADSEESVYLGGAPASFAIDGIVETMWHTAWFQVVPPPHPHFLEVDLGEARAIGGFRYLARQDGASEGVVAAYRFFVNVDGIEWGEPVLAGTLARATERQTVELPSP